MKQIRGRTMCATVLGMATCFFLLLFAGCQPLPENNGKQAAIPDTDKKVNKEQMEVERLKALGVELSYFPVQTVDGFVFPARWTAYINDFSGAASDLESLTAFKPLTYITIQGEFNDQAMEAIAKVSELQNITLVDVPISDEGLAKLVKIKSLKDFRLQGLPRITDKGIDKLCDIATLEKVALAAPKSGPMITSDALKRLGLLKNLTTLELEAPGISDDVLKQVRGLKKLRAVYLTSPRISNAGIKELAEVSELEILTLDDTAITNDSMKSLSKSRKLGTLHIGTSRRRASPCLPSITLRKSSASCSWELCARSG